MKYIDVKNLKKEYKMGDTSILANEDISFEINQGEFVVILGQSGAGKSTTMNLLAGMDYPTEGEIIVDGENIANYNNRKQTLYRRNNIGFVFQSYNLIPYLTAEENAWISSLS